MWSDQNMRFPASLESDDVQTTAKGLVLVLILTTGFFLVVAVASAFEITVVQHLGAKELISTVLQGSTMFASLYILLFIPSLFIGALALKARRTLFLAIAEWLGLLTAVWFLAAEIVSHLVPGIPASGTQQAVSSIQSAIYVLIGLTVAYFGYRLKKFCVAKDPEFV